MPLDLLSADEATLDAAAEVAIRQDPRFLTDGDLLVFSGEIPAEMEDELDHRLDRERHLDRLERGMP